MDLSKKVVLLSLFIYWILISILFTYYTVDYTSLTLAYFAVPPTILTIFNRKFFLHTSIFGFTFGLPMGLYSQLISEVNKVWNYDPNLIFRWMVIKNFHINFDLKPLFWFIIFYVFIANIYLFFLDKHNHRFANRHLLKNHKKYFLCSLFSVFLTFSLYFINYKYFVFHYAYATLIFPIVLLTIFYYFASRRIYKDFNTFVLLCLITFVPLFLYEIVGLKENMWWYHGQYLYQLNFFNTLIPVEEFVVWILIWPMSVVASFEIFEKPKKIK